jgi:glucan phosphoethanolaminetransferase (alkaline phosphatase superfamily)
MTIHEYCANEKWVSVKMRYEYILVHEDKYVFSHINKDNKLDFKTINKWRLTGLAVLSIFLVYIAILTWNAIANQFYSWLPFPLICLSMLIVAFFRILFLETSASVIRKEAIIDVYTAKKRIRRIIPDDNLYMKYKDEKNRTKIRKILLPIDKVEREVAIRFLREYKILMKK